MSEISLDNDLGDDEHDTGYDVVLWIEESVLHRVLCLHVSRFILPIHQQEQRWNLAFNP